MSEMKSTSSSSSPIKNPQLTLASDTKLNNSSTNETNKMEKLNLQLSFMPYIALYDISKSNLFSLKNRHQLEKFELIKDQQSSSSHWSSNTSLNSYSINSRKSSSSGLRSTRRKRTRYYKPESKSSSMNLRSKTQDDTRCSASISQQRQSIVAKYLSRRNNRRKEEEPSINTDDNEKQNSATIEMNKRWNNLLSGINEQLNINRSNDDSTNAQDKCISPSSSILLARISETSSSLNITFSDIAEIKFDDSIIDQDKSVSASQLISSQNVDEHNEEKLVQKNEPIILKINKSRINDARNARRRHKKDKRKRQHRTKKSTSRNSDLNKAKKPEEKKSEPTVAVLSLENDNSKQIILNDKINNNLNGSTANDEDFEKFLRPKLHFYSKSQANNLGILEKNAVIIRERKGLPPIVKRLKRDELKPKPKPRVRKRTKAVGGIKRKPGRPKKNNENKKTAVPVEKIVEELPCVEYEDGKKLPSLPMIDMNSKSTIIAASSDGIGDDSCSTAFKKNNSCHENLDEGKKIIESEKITDRSENDNTGKTADITFFYVQTVDGSIISKQEIKFNEFDKKKSDKLIDKKKTLKKTSVKIVDDIILQKKINLSELNNTTLDNNEKKTKLIGQNRQIHFTTEEMKKRKILHSSEFNPMNKDEINSYGIRTTIPSRQSLLPTKRPVISEEINNKLVRAFENWVKIPEIAELLQERPDIKILKPKVNLKDRLGDYVKNDNDKYEKIQSQRGIITINPQKLTPIKPIPISPFNVASPKESIISNKVFIESPLINNHNEISRVPKNQLISSNPMIKEQYISPQERVPITTINPPHQISSNVSAFNRITYKRPLESQKSSNLSEEPQNKRKTVWKRDYDDLESEDSSVENPIVDNSSSKSQHTVESIGNSQSSSILTTESITQRVKNWCYDGRETISPIGNADDNSNSCHSLSSVKTIIFSPKESNLSSSLLLHVNNNDISIDKCQEINEKMDLEIVNDYDSHNSILSTSYCSSTSSITSSLATESAGINLIDDIQVNCNEKKDDAGHLSPINLPMKSSITDLPDDSNTKQDDDKQSLSSNLSRKSSAISLCDDLNIPEDNNEEENSQNEIVTDTNKINDGNYNINDNNTINNNFNENSNNNNNNNQFNVDPEDEEKIDDCDVISLYAESIESLQVNDIDTKDERERESIYSSSSLNRYNLMKSENIGCYVSQNVREFDALYNNENNDDQNNNIPIARPKGVFTRLQPLNSTTEESQNINNNGINRNIPTQNFTDYQQFNVPSTVRHYNYNNFINYNETQQKFRGYCYSILKRNICNKCDCKFKHTIEDYLLYVHLGQNYEIKSVLNYAIQEKFIYYLKLVYENSIKKLDLPDIIEVFSSVLSLNFPYVVYECFNSTLKVFPKHSNKMFQFINGICQNMQPSTNITDDKITLNLIELLMKHIEPGKYWEYLRGLILKMAFPTLKIIEIILDECSRYKKSPQHVHDIKKIIIDNADENVLREIDPLIISNFMKLYDDLRNFHELKSSPNQIEKTAFVSSIASPDLINTNNSNKIIINEQNGRIMAEDILPIKRISTDLRNRLGFKQPDNSAKWKLMKIDNIDKLNSVYKKQLERLHDDLELLSIALNKKDYDTILSILTIARVGLLQEHIFAYGKGFYEILCKCIMDAPEHLEKIILITVKNGRMPHYLSTMLMNIGIKVLQKLINFGAWIIAKKLLQLLNYYHGKNDIDKNYNELTSASFILLSAEIYIANQQPIMAFELIKQNNLMKKERNEWKVVSKNEDEKLRIIILKLLFKSLSLNHVEHAFLSYKTILEDQKNSFIPLDLSMFTDCIILGLLRDDRDDNLIEMINLMFEYYLFASPMTIRAMIGKIFHLDKILSRQLFTYASQIGIYPSEKRLKNVEYFLLTINIDWTEEEMYLIVEDYLNALYKELGNNLHSIKSRKLLIFVNFQQMYPSSEQMYDDNVNNGKLNNSKLLVNAKKKMRKVLRKFNPPLKFNQHYQSYQLCRFVSSSVINYIKKLYINDIQTKNQ